MIDIESELLRKALDAVRLQLPQDRWDSFAEAIVRDRRPLETQLAAEPPEGNFRHLLETLKAQSFVRLPITLQGVGDARAFLEQFPVHKGPHAYTYNTPQVELSRARLDYPLVGYRSDQVVRAPGVIDQFNDPRLIDLIEAYLGCVPTLYSVNAWWSFPAAKPELYQSQFFHRDTDDWRFVTLFVYLTDVDETGGPHQIVAGSQTLEGMEALTRRPMFRKSMDAKASFVSSMGPELAEQCERYVRDKIVSLTGGAGSMFLVNTLALHRGLMPTKTPRLMMWARYGLGPTCISADQEHGPISTKLVPTSLPDTPRNRYVNRLLLEFPRRPGS
jgi:hypothetical protein